MQETMTVSPVMKAAPNVNVVSSSCFRGPHFLPSCPFMFINEPAGIKLRMIASDAVILCSCVFQLK